MHVSYQQQRGNECIIINARGMLENKKKCDIFILNVDIFGLSFTFYALNIYAYRLSLTLPMLSLEPAIL